MSETEARAADDATSGAGSSTPSFSPAGSGKHRAPVEPVGPTPSSSPSWPAPAATEEPTRAAEPDAEGARRSWSASDDDDTRVIPQYVGDDDRHDDVGDEDEDDEGDRGDGVVDESPEAAPEAPPEREPSWWHRSHPTFAGLVGFFAGVLYVIVIPGVYAALLSWLVSEKKAQSLFPLILVALVVPIGMLVPRKTRRFAQFMLLGVVSTAVVVVVTAAVVFWVLVKTSG